MSELFLLSKGVQGLSSIAALQRDQLFKARVDVEVDAGRAHRAVVNR